MFKIISRAYTFLRFVRRDIRYRLSTISFRIQAILLGVNLGKRVKFYGKPYIQKAASGNLTIGDNCSFRSHSTSNLIGINRPCILSVAKNGNLTIGKHCGFSGTVVGCFSEIIIEDFVKCGANTLITDGDWHFDDKRAGPSKPIHIKRNVWLGVNVIVMKGVTIGENSLIGAGSVVTKDIPSNVIAAGNPCKIIRSINPDEGSNTISK
ncbi:MAG: acyltransferase [Bacteroidia bacterium]|nr:acyltransferase [Bacteroidia bacterium]